MTRWLPYGMNVWIRIYHLIMTWLKIWRWQNLCVMFGWVSFIAINFVMQTAKHDYIICGNHNYKVVVICNSFLQPSKKIETQLQTCLRYKMVCIQPNITWEYYFSCMFFSIRKAHCRHFMYLTLTAQLNGLCAYVNSIIWLITAAL